MGGEVQVAGLTPLEVQSLLTERYTRFVTAPSVSVLVTQVNSRKVFILGQVKEPGAFDILQPTNVMQALAMAGGMTPFAAANKIKILRREGSGVSAIPFRYGDIEKGENLEQNILLLPGDRIVVPEESPFWR